MWRCKCCCRPEQSCIHGSTVERFFPLRQKLCLCVDNPGFPSCPPEYSSSTAYSRDERLRCPSDSVFQSLRGMTLRRASESARLPPGWYCCLLSARAALCGILQQGKIARDRGEPRRSHGSSERLKRGKPKLELLRIGLGEISDACGTKATLDLQMDRQLAATRRLKRGLYPLSWRPNTRTLVVGLH